jgi:hypothetical protein
LAVTTWLFICNDSCIIFAVSPQRAFDAHNENR